MLIFFSLTELLLNCSGVSYIDFLPFLIHHTKRKKSPSTAFTHYTILQVNLGSLGAHTENIDLKSMKYKCTQMSIRLQFFCILSLLTVCILPTIPHNGILLWKLSMFWQLVTGVKGCLTHRPWRAWESNNNQTPRCTKGKQHQEREKHTLHLPSVQSFSTQTQLHPSLH